MGKGVNMKNSDKKLLRECAEQSKIHKARAEERQPAQSTPTPWRVGDAGMTVFGPPNGNPSPKTVASVRSKPDAALIVKAVSAHDFLVKTLEEIGLQLERGSSTMAVQKTVREAIARAEGGSR